MKTCRKGNHIDFITKEGTISACIELEHENYINSEVVSAFCFVLRTAKENIEENEKLYENFASRIFEEYEKNSNFSEYYLFGEPIPQLERYITLIQEENTSLDDVKNEIIEEIRKAKEILDKTKFKFGRSNDFRYEITNGRKNSLLKLQYEIQRNKYIFEDGIEQLQCMKEYIDKWV
jgi:hypothetical protein